MCLFPLPTPLWHLRPLPNPNTSRKHLQSQRCWVIYGSPNTHVTSCFCSACELGFSKCGPQGISISNQHPLGNVTETKILRPHPTLTASERQGGVSDLCCHNPSRWPWSTLNFENHHVYYLFCLQCSLCTCQANSLTSSCRKLPWPPWP